METTFQQFPANPLINSQSVITADRVIGVTKLKVKGTHMHMS